MAGSSRSSSIEHLAESSSEENRRRRFPARAPSFTIPGQRRRSLPFATFGQFAGLNKDGWGSKPRNHFSISSSGGTDDDGDDEEAVAGGTDGDEESEGVDDDEVENITNEEAERGKGKEGKSRNKGNKQATNQPAMLTAEASLSFASMATVSGQNVTC